VENLDELKILITGSLNEELSKEEIKNQLDKLGKELKVTIGTDQKQLDDLSRKIKEIQEDIKSNAKSTFIFDDKITSASTEKLNKQINEIIKKYRELGTVTSKKIFDPSTGELKGLNLEVEKANGLIEKLNFQLKRAQTGDFKFEDKFVLTNQTVLDKTQKIREKQLQTEQKINKQIEKQNKDVERQLSLFQRRMAIDVDKLRSKFTQTVDHKALDDFEKAVNTLNKDTPNLSKRIEDLSLDFRKLKAEASESARSSLSMAEALRTAFQKFPIWLVASTSIYGTIAAVKSLISVIVDVDTALTNLKKVMDQDTNFDQVMESAAQSAERFAKSLSDTLEAYETFAKQGYKEQDLQYLGNAGIVASNIGEIDTQTAAEYLTSALVQWNMETKEAMRIIDSWNEISNNYSTTVENLAQGHARAASTAEAMGLTFDQVNAIIGTLTATTRQSGNEIGNFLKNVLPRLTSQPAEDALNLAGVSLFDEQGNMRNAVEIYADVAEKFKEMDSYNRSIVAEGLAGKYHISRMTAFLDDLGKANSMYRTMLDTSINSEGSAVEENEKYMESLQARINLLRLEYEKFALALGEDFLTEGFIQTIQGLQSGLESARALIKELGALPILLGLIGMGFGGLSKNINRFSQDLIFGTKTMSRTQVAVKGLSTALKGLTASFGVGLIFTGIGWIADKILSKMGESRQRMEELEAKTRQMTEAYSSNREEVKQLVAKYEELDDIIKNGQFGIDFNKEDLDEYQRITNELGTLMPDLVVSEDQYGNKILQSVDKVRAKTEALERQVEIQERLQALQRQEEVKDTYDTAIDELNKKQKELENFFVGIPHIDNIDELNKKIDEFYKKVESGEQKRLNIGQQKNLDFYENLKNEYDMLTNEIERQQLLYQQAVMDMIDINLKLDESTSSTAKSLIEDFSTLVLASGATSDQITAIFDNILNAIQNDSSFANLLQNYSKAVEDFKLSVEDSTSIDKIEEYKDKAVQAFEEIKEAILSLADGNLTEQELNAIANQLTNLSPEVILLSLNYDKLSESTGKSKEEIIKQLRLVPELADEMGHLSDETGNVAEEMEKLTEVYDNAISNIRSLNGIINDLNDGQGLSADKISFLMKEYPQLLAYLNDEAALRRAIQDEIENETQVALDSIHQKLMADENFIKSTQVLNSELYNWLKETYGIDLKNFTSLAKAKEKVESQLLSGLSKKWADYYRITADGMMAATDDFGLYLAAGGAVTPEQQAELKKFLDIAADYNQKAKELEERFRSVTVSTVDFGKAIRTSGLNVDKATKSANKNAKQTKDTVYVADTYTEAIEELNIALERLNSIKNNYAKHSSEYRKAIQQEIGLLQQKAKLLESQRKSLQQQISSGKIQQTGIIQIDTNSKAIGNSVSEKIWNFLKSKGFSDTVAAGIMGNLKMESNLNPSAVNPRSGAYGIAQWLGSRKTALQNFARSRGTSMSNLQTQLDFLWKELNSTEKRTLNYLRSNQGASAATIAAMFDKLFERSEGTHVPQRQNYANQFLKQYAGKVVGKNKAEAARDVDQAKLDVLDLEKQIIDINEQIEALNLEIVNSRIAGYDYQIRQYSKELARLDYLQQLAGNNSFELMNIENKRIDILEKQRKIQKQSINYINQQIKSNKKLTQAQKDQLSEELINRTETLIQLERELLNLREENANRVIDVYKKVIEVQRDQSIKAIEDELDAFEKAHRRKMKLLEDELDAYEEIINAQKEALRDQKDQEDHNKRMSEYAERMQELQSKYNEWKRDDSAYGQLRAKEIKKEIEELQKEIQEYQSDRQYELQDRALDKLLEEKRKQIENEKELEEQAYDTGREKLEKQREDISRHYENLLNDERAFNEMRNQILTGSIKNINKQLNNFTTYIQKNMKSIGESISENLIDQLITASRLLSTISGSVPEAKKGSTSNLNSFLNSLKKNGFDKGGYVGHDGFTFVHGGERVLNKEDNKNFERTMSFLDKAKSWITPIINQPSLLKTPTFATETKDININMPIHIANMNGTKQDADNFFNTINTKLTHSGILSKLK
jgi:TP901 family phage tail tape measure protein